MILFFIEWPEQIEEALKKVKAHKDITFVAFTTLVAHELELRKIPYIYPDHFFSLEKNKNIFITHYKRLEKLCKWADTEVWKEWRHIKENNISPFVFNYFFIKTLWDSLANRIFQINHLIRCMDVSKVYYFDHDIFEPVGHPDTCQIIKILAESMPIFEKINFDCQKVKSHLRKEDYASCKLLKKINWYSRFLNLGRKLKRLFLPSAHSLAFHGIDLALIKSVSKGPFGYVNPKKIELFLNEIHLPADDFEKIKKILNHKKFKEHFLLDGIDFNKLIFTRIAKAVANNIPSQIQINNIKDFIKNKKIRNIFLITLINPHHKIISVIAKNMNSRVSVLQHGAMGIHNEKIIYYSDVLFATDYYVYGKSVKKYFENVLPTNNCLIHLFDSKKILLGDNKPLKRKVLCNVLGLDPDKPIFIFQISGILYNHFYYSFNTPGDYEEYEQQKKIITYFKENTDIQLIVKLHPSRYNIAGGLSQSLEARNIKFLRDIPMNLLIEACDKFITDRPSTGMLQAMLYEKECFAYNNTISFWGDDKLLTKAVNYFKNAEELLEYISQQKPWKQKQELVRYIKNFAYYNYNPSRSGESVGR